ncbi:unnamed protein product [Vitrella brassicaformis CCMP3155]|uniref:Apple domain-containing protein n=1 Tax=Vitrella brassicaformis (strain CCMP3155) TaxID=1169540 RepID=A0A0G4GCT7_VITBC|nr:unnamed protein product [Vitrella brassicaformis CCMP3155]|eukprot:CEM26959.1 unnamed protein product [Vitrella brassicaformis CCMP3155]
MKPQVCVLFPGLLLLLLAAGSKATIQGGPGACRCSTCKSKYGDHDNTKLDKSLTDEQRRAKCAELCAKASGCTGYELSLVASKNANCEVHTSPISHAVTSKEHIECWPASGNNVPLGGPSSFVPSSSAGSYVTYQVSTPYLDWQKPFESNCFDNVVFDDIDHWDFVLFARTASGCPITQAPLAERTCWDAANTYLPITVDVKAVMVAKSEPFSGWNAWEQNGWANPSHGGETMVIDVADKLYKEGKGFIAIDPKNVPADEPGVSYHDGKMYVRYQLKKQAAQLDQLTQLQICVRQWVGLTPHMSCLGPVTLHSDTVSTALPMEVGKVTMHTRKFTTIETKKTFTSPVVFMGIPPMMNGRGHHEVVVRIKDVTPNSFQADFDEPVPCRDQWHRATPMPWMVIEAGVHTVATDRGSITVAAGTAVVTDNKQWFDITFPPEAAFVERPIILLQTKDTNRMFVKQRVQNLTNTGFQVALETQVLGWVAFSGAVNSVLYAPFGQAILRGGITPKAVTEQHYRIDFGTTIKDGYVFGNIASYWGDNASQLRLHEQTDDYAKVIIQEETCTPLSLLCHPVPSGGTSPPYQFKCCSLTDPNACTIATN